MLVYRTSCERTRSYKSCSSVIPTHLSCFYKINRPIGHFAHQRNQFKSINIFAQRYAYIITLIFRGKKPINSFLIIGRSLFAKHWVPFTRVWLKLAKCFFRGRFLNSELYFGFFQNISPWKRTWVFICKTWIPFVLGCFTPSLVEIGRLVLEKEIFQFHQYFSLFLNDLFLKKVGSFTLTNLNLLYPRMLFDKFGLNWSILRRRFLNFINVFSLFRNKLDHMRPFHPRMLCFKYG